MTTKTTKTIILASLITAMILPFSVMDIANAESNSQSYVVTGPEPEIQALLDKASDPNRTNSEQQDIKKQLNALGVPTSKQLEKNPEFWTQKVLEKAQKKILKQQEKENKKTNFFSQSSTLKNDPSVTDCPTCPPNDKMAFMPGFYYDCGQTYMCSVIAPQWTIVDEGTDKTTAFYFSYQQTDVWGWYYAQAPNGSSNAQWDDIYIVLPTDVDFEHSFNEDADPMKFKLLNRVNNNASPHQLSFTFDVISVT